MDCGPLCQGHSVARVNECPKGHEIDAGIERLTLYILYLLHSSGCGSETVPNEISALELIFKNGNLD